MKTLNRKLTALTIVAIGLVVIAIGLPALANALPMSHVEQRACYDDAEPLPVVHIHVETNGVRTYTFADHHVVVGATYVTPYGTGTAEQVVARAAAVELSELDTALGNTGDKGDTVVARAETRRAAILRPIKVEHPVVLNLVSQAELAERQVQAELARAQRAERDAERRDYVAAIKAKEAAIKVAALAVK